MFLPELLAAFGFLFESVTLASKPTVGTAFAMLRLHADQTECKVAAETALRLSTILRTPRDSKLWKMNRQNSGLKRA